MPRFTIKFDGVTGFDQDVEQASLDQARNKAIVLLGGYLQTHPEFAYQRHWRVDVLDQTGRLVTHVIVATVDAPPPINWQSFEHISVDKNGRQAAASSSTS